MNRPQGNAALVALAALLLTGGMQIAAASQAAALSANSPTLSKISDEELNIGVAGECSTGG
ncbi:hypothetical protein [Embleya sp. NPDC001921]